MSMEQVEAALAARMQCLDHPVQSNQPRGQEVLLRQ